jgi:hypothetical protein
MGGPGLGDHEHQAHVLVAAGATSVAARHEPDARLIAHRSLAGVLVVEGRAWPVGGQEHAPQLGAVMTSHYLVLAAHRRASAPRAPRS